MWKVNEVDVLVIPVWCLQASARVVWLYGTSCSADALQGDFTAFDQDHGEVINCYRRVCGMC